MDKIKDLTGRMSGQNPQQSGKGQESRSFASVITISGAQSSDPSQALQSILPTASSQRGFQGAQHLSDPASGKAMVILNWESEQAYQQAKKAAGYAEQLNQLGSEQTFEVTSMGSSPSGPSSSSRQA
jgi:hypothetical protein